MDTPRSSRFRFSYVAKAKSLMMSTARTAALVIVPLAVTVNAHAGTVSLPIGNYNCSTTLNTSSGSCSGGDSQLADLGSGVRGLSFFTSGSLFFPILSGSGNGQQITVTMTDNGTVSGAIPLGTTIPVGGPFGLTDSGGTTITSWFLSFGLGLAEGDHSYAFSEISGTGTGALDPSFLLNVSSTIPASSQLWETVELMVFADPSALGGSGGVTIDVSGADSNSWNFNSVPATQTPEPSSLGLMGSGLGLIWAWARRRKKQFLEIENLHPHITIG